MGRVRTTHGAKAESAKTFRGATSSSRAAARSLGRHRRSAATRGRPRHRTVEGYAWRNVARRARRHRRRARGGASHLRGRVPRRAPSSRRVRARGGRRRPRRPRPGRAASAARRRGAEGLARNRWTRRGGLGPHEPRPVLASLSALDAGRVDRQGSASPGVARARPRSLREPVLRGAASAGAGFAAERGASASAPPARRGLAAPRGASLDGERLPERASIGGAFGALSGAPRLETWLARAREPTYRKRSTRRRLRRDARGWSLGTRDPGCKPRRAKSEDVDAFGVERRDERSDARRRSRRRRPTSPAPASISVGRDARARPSDRRAARDGRDQQEPVQRRAVPQPRTARRLSGAVPRLPAPRLPCTAHLELEAFPSPRPR